MTLPAHIPARHPSQLYEAVLEGLVLFAILWLYSRRPRPTFSVGGLFLFFYGTFRFAVEFFHEPDAQIGFAALGWMSRGQELSIPMIVAGAALFVYAYTRKTPGDAIATPQGAAAGAKEKGTTTKGAKRA